MHHRTSSASIRNSVSTRSGTVGSATTFGGTFRNHGTNERVGAAAECHQHPSSWITAEIARRFPTLCNGLYIEEVIDRTETDLTETTRTDFDDVVIREIASLSLPSSSQTLPRIEELVERLREVTCEGEQRVKSSIVSETPRTAMSLDEITQLLRDVNRCEEELVVPASQAMSNRWEHHRTQSSCWNRALLTRTKTDLTNMTITKSMEEQAPARSFSAHHAQLLPLPEFIDRLVRVNAEFTESRLNHVMQRNSKVSFSVKDITRILRHIDCRREVDGPEEHACGAANDFRIKIVHKPQGRSVADFQQPCQIRSKRRSCHSLGSIISSHTRSSWTEEVGGIYSIDVAPLTDEDQFSTMDALHDNLGDDRSGFTLNASVQSCRSSVTWYEGSDIDEISVDEEILI